MFLTNKQAATHKINDMTILLSTSCVFSAHNLFCFSKKKLLDVSILKHKKKQQCQAVPDNCRKKFQRLKFDLYFNDRRMWIIMVKKTQWVQQQ